MEQPCNKCCFVVRNVYPNLFPSFVPLEHVSRCHIWAKGGSGADLLAHHHRIHILLPVVLCIWKAACGSVLPCEGGPAAEQGERLYSAIQYVTDYSHCKRIYAVSGSVLI